MRFHGARRVTPQKRLAIPPFPFKTNLSRRRLRVETGRVHPHHRLKLVDARRSSCICWIHHTHLAHARRQRHHRPRVRVSRPRPMDRGANDRSTTARRTVPSTAGESATPITPRVDLPDLSLTPQAQQHIARSREVQHSTIRMVPMKLECDSHRHNARRPDAIFCDQVNSISRTTLHIAGSRTRSSHLPRHDRADSFLPRARSARRQRIDLLLFHGGSATTSPRVQRRPCRPRTLFDDTIRQITAGTSSTAARRHDVSETARIAAGPTTPCRSRHQEQLDQPHHDARTITGFSENGVGDSHLDHRRTDHALSFTTRRTRTIDGSPVAGQFKETPGADDQRSIDRRRPVPTRRSGSRTEERHDRTHHDRRHSLRLSARGHRKRPVGSSFSLTMHLVPRHRERLDGSDHPRQGQPVRHRYRRPIAAEPGSTLGSEQRLWFTTQQAGTR